MEKQLHFKPKQCRKNCVRSGRLLIICFTIFIFCIGDGLAFNLQQEPITITGTVTDVNGVPLPGVTIMEKDTNNGITTDFDGNYSIDVNSSEDILVFSYVGMVTVERKVGQYAIINVQLEPDEQSLEEIVLVGYGKQKKISVVGAQSTVNPEKLRMPVANMTTMLAGRVAGLTGVQRDGLPGYDGADIWIRGLSSLSGNSHPLILVDGVERSMDNLNPRDIESFTVLKDASATAVYGVRGANGVILIKTKRGQIGKPKITIDYNEGFTQFTQMPDLVDGITYMKLANEALTTRGEAPKYSQETIKKTMSGEQPLLYPNVDWFDEVFNEYGRNRSALANVSGGSESAVYYVSLGYYDETGLFVTEGLEEYDSDTKYKRYNFTSNLTVDITESTSMHLGIQGYVSEGNYPATGVGAIFEQAMMVPPVEYPVVYPGGFVPGRSANGDLRNPYADVAMRGYKNENKNQLYSNLRLTQDLEFLTEGLTVTGMFAFDTYNQHFITRSKRESTYIVDLNFPYTQNGELLLTRTYTGKNYLGYGRNNWGERTFYLEAAINYQRAFGKHEVSSLLLANRNDRVDAGAGDFTGSIPYRNQGLAGRVTYGYDDRYFAEVNAGYNGSENFAPENRYGFFPSAAVGWIISNENFFEPLDDVISFLKIRYSDGLVGKSSGAGRFAYQSRVEDGQNGYNFGENPRGIGGIAETYTGVNVTWAESRKQDLGIELNMFDNSLRIVFDVFKEHTEGGFLSRSDIPNYVGLVSDPYGNLAEVENKGFDGTVEYSIHKKDFSLNFRGTFSYSESTILENGRPEQLYPWMDRRGSGILGRWGYIAERLYTLEDDVNGDGFISPEDGDEYPVQFGQIMPGDIKYTDLNDDGEINAYDQKQIGNGDLPYLTYGLAISAQYKNFDAAVFLQGQSNADINLGGLGIMPFLGDGGRGNMYAVAKDRWTVENNDSYAMYPRLSYGSSAIGQNNNTQTSTWWTRDVNFLRVKTAELGYTLPKSLSDKVDLSIVRFYLRGTNLLTFTDFDLWDPELNTDNGGSYPNVSVLSLGVNFQF